MGQTIVVNWIDWITLAIVLVSILRGTRYGVLAGVLDLLAMVASFFAASVLYTRAVPPLRQSLLLPAPWAGFVAVVVIWLILYFLAGIIIRLIVGKKKLALSEVLGGLVGGIRGLALTTILLVLLVAAPFREAIARDADQSTAAAYLLRAYDAVMASIAPTMPVHIPRIGPGGIRF
jgi:uncharacterized membrane protein required for colicin V production